VDFLEHIPYYSIPASSHNLTQSKLIKIDPFEEPTPIVSPIPPEPALETTSETRETTTTTETPPVIISEAIPTVTQPPPTSTQSSSEVAVVPPANVRPTRIRKSTRKDDFVYSCYSSLFSLFIASVDCLHEPKSYREAVCDPLWHVALAEEFVALHQSQTWDLVPLPVGKHAIGSRCVYKIKTKSDGSIERYKIRLVAKGYAQE
ncbi:gag-pol polyprotein, partial [Tanacetum coccineum]